MRRYVLSPKAQSDVEEIWDYTAAQWGQWQAETYVRLIKACIEAVTANPGLGRSAAEIRTGYRKYPAGSHVLFYCVRRDTLEVVRILHERMDFDRHF